MTPLAYHFCLALLPWDHLLLPLCESSLTERDEDAADAGDPAGDHGEEEDPAPAPLVHGVPAHEVGGHLKLGILYYHLIIKLIIMEPPLPR